MRKLAKFSLSQKKILYFSTLWPEYNATSAGSRTKALIEYLLRLDCKISYISATKKNSFSGELDKIGVGTYTIPFNSNDSLRETIKSLNPDLAIFDRFISEEGYSHILQEVKPECMKVLDLQDLHSLRTFREALYPAITNISSSYIESYPDSSNPRLLRELSSINRCDLTIVCSAPEWRLLTNEYGIHSRKLVVAPLFGAGTQNKFSLGHSLSSGPSKNPTMKNRQHFISIGNWKHAPNLDSAKWLINEIWPLIHKRIRGAELHLYGARANSEASSLHNPEKSVYMNGHLDLISNMGKYRVLVSPLRYGAGVKGKIADAWSFHTPVATTLVGREGMTELDFPWLCDGGNGDWEGLVPIVNNNTPQVHLQKTLNFIDKVENPPNAINNPSPLPQQDSDPETSSLLLETNSPLLAPQGNSTPSSSPLTVAPINSWGGLVSMDGDPQEIANQAVDLYLNKDLWIRCSLEGRRLLSLLFDKQRNLQAVGNALSRVFSDLQSHRGRDYAQGLLLLETTQSTKYFSKFLEALYALKEKEEKVKEMEARLALNERPQENENNESNKETSSPSTSPSASASASASHPPPSPTPFVINDNDNDNDPDLDLDLDLDPVSDSQPSTTIYPNKKRIPKSSNSPPHLPHPKGWLIEDN